MRRLAGDIQKIILTPFSATRGWEDISMICLTHANSLDWLKEHGYAHPVDQDNLGCRVSMTIPTDAGHKRALAQDVFSWFPRDGDCLLLVTAWGIWPSCEIVRLFDLVRKALGENRPLHEVPGHVLRPAEWEDLECLFAICLYNFWDAVLADIAHRCIVTVSHDEWGACQCVAEFEAEARRCFQEFAKKVSG